MSGPNTNYDPVEVAALEPAAVQAAVDAALAAIAAASSLDELKAARTAHQGEKSPLALANREIGALPPSAKAEAGKRVGQARGRVGQALAARQAELEAERDERILVEERVDVTVPALRRRLGARHPIELVAQRLVDSFVGMGWEVAEGPELEAEWLNFDALNLGPDHPARQMQDTFFLDPVDSGLVLRTHTSPVQIRTMLEKEPPIYIVAPGKVFRTDDLDATHTPVFHQIECLAVDKGLTMAHLRGAIDAFVQIMFGEGTRTRVRASYFPFTEPSMETDFVCFACHGSGSTTPGSAAQCRTCGGSGWIELGGSGMVNRKVLAACGIDPDVYSGFAFGLGIERALMLRHGVQGMHEMVEGDVRFSQQFGMEV
ncbi:phenylalanyl-tRNA synthetase subunit alpha [Intrasporangium chromatireducens Q5-1]|uniref:Phenylalanine--tRNA ligase alpha subunit n=1 Tax=Intrasporangium chromatireducens Q5-1 TaxID=584657 RepID=W9GJ77_9MICO|nr:phenylalanine--tRNA ligase subunit alpha [Intrasporangium chromatireducens]EWT04873.1 phenylalanyl-tRNA synthetase subunit alpha [Intrasporangium chromatireducens Q5-1]